MRGVWTIVVAAGSGSRFGGPKQLAPLAGGVVLDHSLRAAAAVSEGIALVVPAGLVENFGVLGAVHRTDGTHPELMIVEGGTSRSGSVRAGLVAVPESALVIVVHDGARPLASVELFARVINAVTAGADAAVPATAVTDSIRHLESGAVDRSELVSVQTPQAFGAARIRAAHRGGSEATDDASLVEADGGTVVLVSGSETNLKITNPADLAIAETLFARRYDADATE